MNHYKPNEGDNMYILTAILLFIIISIAAATKGDWSGMEAIGKVILFIALFFIVGFIIINPGLLVIAILIFVVILLGYFSK